LRNCTCTIAQEGGELIILDQHGAHERILYERLSENPRAEAIPLPSPVVARLPEDLAPEMSNFEVEMHALGFRFEPFGEGAVRISAVPATVTDPETALLAALHALAGGEDLAKALACKGSTRFGAYLSSEEMEVLLREWSATEFRGRAPQSGRTPVLYFRALLTEDGDPRVQLHRA
jgi:DNA mismatch repair protein MutL